jgi:hypothetical protein
MWNPFAHEREHQGIFEASFALANAIDDLRKDIKELRKEVDYLADFLDD